MNVPFACFKDNIVIRNLKTKPK